MVLNMHVPDEQQHYAQEVYQDANHWTLTSALQSQKH